MLIIPTNEIVFANVLNSLLANVDTPNKAHSVFRDVIGRTCCTQFC